MSEVDERFMALAVAQATLALGTTAPNPSVGAVLVRDGVVLGAGHTQPIGGAHAEVMALAAARQAGHDTAGATMYVTLEPCRHVGRTPPCTLALIQAGVVRVVVGSVDPYPPMRGRGLSDLQHAGIDVHLGLRGAACDALLRGFSRALRHGLPEVTLKAAASLDGRIATAQGESEWITGADARTDGHRLRASHDAIVVGITTALKDDPQLTTRGVAGTDPVAVVVDTDLRLPATARIFEPRRPVVVICAQDAPSRELPGQVLRVARGPGGVDIEQALRALAAVGLHRVLIEGGGRLIRSVLDARLADHLVLYLGSVIVPAGLPWVGGEPLAHLGDAIRPTLVSAAMVGEDVALRYELCHRLEA